MNLQDVINSKVSIVLATYNVENYIEECLMSLIHQTHKMTEIIVIDDGSTDATGQIVKRISADYNNVIYVFQLNSGVSTARNKGILESLGDYIMFVDGDDVVPRDSINKLLQECDEDTDIVCGCYYAFDEFEKRLEHFFDTSFEMRTIEEKEKLFLQLMNGNYGRKNKNNSTAIGVPWGKLYRKKFLEENEILFNPVLRRMQDNIFNMKAFYYAKCIKYCDFPCYFYRLNHVKSLNFICSPELWHELLEERSSFIDRHIELKKCMMIQSYQRYETNVGLASSVGYIVEHYKKKEAANEFDKLRKSNDYQKIYSSLYQHIKPLRFFGIAFLLKYKCFSLLYYVMRIFIEIKNRRKNNG